MADPTRLRQLLVEYLAALEEHDARVRDAFAELEKDYERLRPVYRGEGATEFKKGFDRSRAAFSAYTERMPRMTALLQDKTDQLAAFDANDV